MSDEKPDLYTIQKSLVDRYPEYAIEHFLSSVNATNKASIALKAFLKDINQTSLDSSVIIDLIKKAYPGINVSSISGVIHDSGYLNVKDSDLTDDEFDNLINDVFNSPSEW